MDLKDSLVNGGMLIAHQVKEGKHQYEVENVVKYKKGKGAKMFYRKGDKLMQINGINLEDLTPEELAEMLAEGNPMLTVQQNNKTQEHAEPPCQPEDILHPFAMETTTIRFSWDMMRGEDSEEKEEGPEGETKETKSIEDVCKEENGEKEEEGGLLVIEMTKTNISLIAGRGCDEPGCSLNDIVMVAESSTVTLVPRGNDSFKQEKLLNALIEHVPSQRYLKGICSQQVIVATPNQPNLENITIYLYKSNIKDRATKGVPVVLNLTDSNCFIKCCMVGDKVLLKVEACEKQKLSKICKSDTSTISFVFYMKANRQKQRSFESVLHRGWFIT
ncbi:uncharacterized protein KZ484_001155 [Pholidichthys leucotaenia]